MAASWLASQFFVLFFMERELLQLFTLRTRPKTRLLERKKKQSTSEWCAHFRAEKR